MSLFLIVAVVGATMLGLIKGFSSTSAASGSRGYADRPEDDAYALSQSDPIEALSRHGVSENYGQLLEQGVDLRGLGYEPPGEG